jgi:hypothetical protein
MLFINWFIKLFGGFGNNVLYEILSPCHFESPTNTFLLDTKKLKTYEWV